jgi:hypothetical protein
LLGAGFEVWTKRLSLILSRDYWPWFALRRALLLLLASFSKLHDVTAGAFTLDFITITTDVTSNTQTIRQKQVLYNL